VCVCVCVCVCVVCEYSVHHTHSDGLGNAVSDIAQFKNGSIRITVQHINIRMLYVHGSQ